MLHANKKPLLRRRKVRTKLNERSNPSNVCSTSCFGSGAKFIISNIVKMCEQVLKKIAPQKMQTL